jgi:hypothetical protein
MSKVKLIEQNKQREITSQTYVKWSTIKVTEKLDKLENYGKKNLSICKFSIARIQVIS